MKKLLTRFIAMTMAAMLIGCGAVPDIAPKDENTVRDISETEPVDASSELTNGGEPEQTDEIEQMPEPKQTDEVESVSGTIETMGQKNAVKKAKSYLDFMAFSYSGLVKQLEFEGFTHEEAVYAADNCGADWNEQAVKKAESYLDTMSFSRDGLIDQLEFEGFTHEEAVYGVEQNGY